ncbi:MAG: ACP S-malonyltransferase [Bacteroidota bacterium]|nr:ACP S-malonyltransferase [Candidatus Kapabacteria bacterium]MDW8271002.1 ACP S-malonyltransferase [Bacteroidota bacterium]
MANLSTTAFLFSGQGSQYVGMGRSLFEGNMHARQIFERADEVLGFALSEICFNGPEELLKQTRYTQPALFVHEASILAALGEYACAAVAGHSLGEYTALYAAGVIDFEDALRLVALRGELMFQAGIQRPGSMAAVIGLEDDVVESICTQWSEGIVVAANYNSPGQVVISGDRNAVVALIPKFKEAGARMVTELPVSGAFHSPLMQEARDELAKAIGKVRMLMPRCPVYMNVTGMATTEPEQMRHLLIEQLTSPVRWTTTLLSMYADGIRRFVEIGPKSVLQGLARRTLGNEIQVMGIDTLDDLQRYQTVQEKS